MHDQSKQLLGAVRSALAAAVVVVVLPAIDMPAGYMGARDELTRFGALYIGFLAVVTAAIVVGRLRAADHARDAALALHAVNAGVFTPALASDPILAMSVVGWQLVALGFELWRPSHPRRRGGRGAVPSASFDEREEAWFATWGAPARHALSGAVLLIVVVVGYEVTERLLALSTCGIVGVLALSSTIPFIWERLRAERWTAALLFAPWSVVAVEPTPRGALIALALMNLAVLGLLIVRSPLFDELIEFFFEQPALLTVVAFVALISVGTLLLTFPDASTVEGSISAVDALFTSTSASCVTGLIVLDTPNDFTVFGQSVILALIQVGGLGIMVFSTFATVIVGRGLSPQGEQALEDLLDIAGPRDAYRLTRFIVATTVAIELVGALGLGYGYWRRGYTAANAAWHGVFHAISAFCNAGFALQSDSIVMFQDQPWVVLLVGVLIVLGGIGFAVLAVVWTWVVEGTNPRFAVQARVVIATSALLVALGTALYLGLEWSATLSGMSAPDKLVHAFFQSVTLRTAGFNSVAFGPMESATVVVMIAFMIIGASPGSTGGGIKTTTAAVLFGMMRATTTGDDRVVFFGRRIPRSTVYRSVAVAGLYSLFAVAGTVALFAVEPLSFRSGLFEIFSAIGTVGLSLGATGELHTAGKLVIVTLMFIGRTGPVTVALVFGAGVSSALDYPETEIMVG